MLGPHTLLDIISAAGGFLPTASGSVSVTHSDYVAETVHLRPASPSIASQNPLLRPGDRVEVGRGALIYVLGDVGKPGGYVSESSSTVTALRAVALAQGVNKTAQMKATLIRSAPSGTSQSVIELKRVIEGREPDPAMQDGDILYIPVSGAKEWTSKGLTSILQMAVGVVVYGPFR